MAMSVMTTRNPMSWTESSGPTPGLDLISNEAIRVPRGQHRDLWNRGRVIEANRKVEFRDDGNWPNNLGSRSSLLNMKLMAMTVKIQEEQDHLSVA